MLLLTPEVVDECLIKLFSISLTLCIVFKKMYCVSVNFNVIEVDIKPPLRGLINIRSSHWKIKLF